MAKRPDKRQRKEALDLWKAKERAAAREKLRLSDAQLQALFDMLNVDLPRYGCDHSLRLTRNWLAARGLPVEQVVEWLNANGGFCDCEALANAEQNWKDAIADVDW